MNSHTTITRRRKIKNYFGGLLYEKNCTCEEYFLRELGEKRAQVKKLSAACKNYAEVLEDVNTFLDMMKKHLNLHKAADCAWQREKR